MNEPGVTKFVKIVYVLGMVVLCDCKGPVYVYRIAWGSMEWSLTAYIYRCVGVMCLGVCVLTVLLWKGVVLFCVYLCERVCFPGVCGYMSAVSRI